MKRTDKATWLRVLGTLAAMSLAVGSSHGAFLQNPSFEANYDARSPHYSSIDGWTGGSGVNEAVGPFSDNGIIPDRKQVGFIQGTKSLSQTVRGLIPGKNYWFQFYYNARTAAASSSLALVVNLAGKEIANLPGIAAVGPDRPYNFKHVEFVAASETAVLEFATVASGDVTLLLDGVSIVQRDAGQVVLHNPSFEASGTVYPYPGYVQPNLQAGWNMTGNHGINIDGAGPFTDNGRAGDQDLVLFLQGNGASASQNLTGLADGKKYIVGFLVNGRICCATEDTSYSITFADNEIVNETFRPVNAANPYLVRQATFTATGTDGVLKFQHTTSHGDHTLLLDNIVVIPEAGSSPFVLAQPQSMSVEVAGSASFSVSAVGAGTLNHQWKKDGMALAGQTNATLTLDNVTADMVGDYSVDVKNANGTVASDAAHLAVLMLIVKSTFDSGTEDWRARGDASSGIPTFLNSGGNPGGTIRITDKPVGDIMLFIAPSKFLGDQSQAYGGTLEFDIRASGSDLGTNGNGVWLQGGGSTLFYQYPFKPGNGWTHYRLDLNESGGWAKQLSNTPQPIKSKMQAVLASLTELRISGEFVYGAETTWLDNVRLLAPIPPALVISRLTNSDYQIQWPVSAIGFRLESTQTLSPPRIWQTVTDPPSVVNGFNTIKINITGSSTYYRLKKS